MGDVIAAFNLDQASRLTGVSEASLISWDKEGFFVPSLAAANRRLPYSRIYDFDDLVGLRTLALLRSQVSMQHLKKAARKLKRHSGRPWSQLTLYVLNKEVHFRHPRDGNVESAVSGQYGSTIPLEGVAREMRDKANSLRLRDPAKVGRTEKVRFINGNQPVFGGTRISVSSVLELVKSGYTDKQIIEEYPDLTWADIKIVRKSEDCLTCAA